MKSLFFTLLILGAIFVGYDYFLAPPWERLVFEKGPRPATGATPTPAGTSHVIEDDGPAPAATPTATKTKADDWQPTIPKLASNDFVPPTIPSAESVTKNWTFIPKQAFPRAVVLKKDVQVQMSVGASTLRAGATAQAVGSDQGNLIIAPTATSAARGSIAVIDTDFPQQIQASYEKWKATRIEQARQAWVNAKTRITTPGKDNSTLANGLGVSFGADGKPVQNADGSYNLLLAVISTGRVTDVEPKKVLHWSQPRQETIDGKPTWVIDVTYPTNSIFGPMDVASHAHVRDNQLVRWIYDSGEPVP
jgi:hypothetical protein